MTAPTPAPSAESVPVLPVIFDRIRVVLARPSHPGNIGAVARAMKTMGLSRLYLVQPKAFPHEEAYTRASGAVDVLDNAKVCDSLQEALSGVTLAAAMTARRRELSLPMQWSREAALTLAGQLQSSELDDVALVFGNETFGLSNEELSLCQIPVMIPTNPVYASLNLGSAAQLMCYEMHMALRSGSLQTAPAQFGTLATVDEVEQLHAHFERAMTASGFFDPANPKRLMPRLRRLFGRVQLERDEVNILRGMLSFFERPFR